MDIGDQRNRDCGGSITIPPEPKNMSNSASRFDRDENDEHGRSTNLDGNDLHQ
jgi:hypothetical protein